MRNVVGALRVAIVGVVMIGGFIAYLVYATDPATNIMHDGFGRPLSESPWLMRFVFGQDRVWAGWRWFVVDMVLFWGGIALGIGLANWGFKGTLETGTKGAG